jgi:hypothetical protein
VLIVQNADLKSPCSDRSLSARRYQPRSGPAALALQIEIRCLLPLTLPRVVQATEQSSKHPHKPLILKVERVKGIEPSSSAWKSVARHIAVRASEISRGKGIAPGEQDHGRGRQCGLPIGHSEISRNIKVLHRRKAERGVASCGGGS